jgi:hypothetical protein
MPKLLENEENHPSFGMVGISHVTSNGSILVGSEFKHHHFVQLTIKRANKRRDLSREWWFAREELIQVHLSEAQFVELMGRPNMGDGVACTLSRIAGENVPSPPEPTTMKQQFRKDFATHTEECVSGLRSAMKELQDAIDSGNIGKSALRDIHKRLWMAAKSIDDGLPFVQESFEEAMEKTVNHAATEIEATVTQLAIRLGISQMREIAATG